MTSPAQVLEDCLRTALTRTPRLALQWELLRDRGLADEEILHFLRLDLEPAQTYGGPDCPFYGFRGGAHPAFTLTQPDVTLGGDELVDAVRRAFDIPHPRGEHGT